MGFEIGQEVGNYRILQRLGAGGMGEVFLAQHPLIGKTVALKVIHQDMSLNKELVTRFINEAKAVSTIGNDHIVEVHDFGTTPEGAHFFIMEHLDGQTLAKALNSGRLPISDPAHVANCLHIGAQIAAGLSAAHQHNIIHRDLKPDNIMLIDKLGDPLFVKILDFGLAKMLEADTPLTAMGVVLGTPEFMSPEAAESKDIDARSDIYSFGVLLFFMLAGRLPFEASGMGEMMVQHVCQAPPVPRAFNPQIPPAVEQVVLRCLAKNKEDRFQTMDELHAALMNPEGYLSGSPRVVASNGAEGSISAQRVVAAHPDLARPAATNLNTMNIGTPMGYSSGGRRRMSTLIAVALLSGGGGVAAALAQGGSQADESAVETATLAPGVGADPEANTAAVEPAVAPLPQVAAEDITINVTSSPEGAVVTDSAGDAIGTTPFDWDTPSDAGEVSWQFSREGYTAMTYRFAPSAGQPVLVTLLAEVPTNGRKRPTDGKPTRPKKKPKKVENNLIEPDL